MKTQLKDIVEKYLAVAGGYGKAMPLAAFGYSREDTEKTFAAFDEDYHISRFIRFQNESGTSYPINGFPQTHVSIDAEIQSIL